MGSIALIRGLEGTTSLKEFKLTSRVSVQQNDFAKSKQFFGLTETNSYCSVNRIGIEGATAFGSAFQGNNTLKKITFWSK